MHSCNAQVDRCCGVPLSFLHLLSNSGRKSSNVGLWLLFDARDLGLAQRFYTCWSSRVKTVCEVPSAFLCGLHKHMWLITFGEDYHSASVAVVNLLQVSQRSMQLAVITFLAVVFILHLGCLHCLNAFKTTSKHQTAIRASCLYVAMITWRCTHAQ